MKQVKLGATNKEVSAVALGIMRMVRLDTDQAANILNTVHEQGVILSMAPIFMVTVNPKRSLDKPLSSPA